MFSKLIKKQVRYDFWWALNDIDDLIQEALIEFSSKLKTYDGEKEKAFCYIYQSAKWRCIDYLRKEKRYFEIKEICFLNDTSIVESDLASETDLEKRLVSVLKKNSTNHKNVLLLENFGLKTEKNKEFSKSSVRRIKQSFKNDFMRM
jgi:DNA-directed RNA polymerase specialized sigma24 family protein